MSAWFWQLTSFDAFLTYHWQLLALSGLPLAFLAGIVLPQVKIVRVDLAKVELRDNGEPRSLEPQVFALIAYLAEQDTPVADRGKFAYPPSLVVIDGGVKRQILRHLAARGCRIEVVPAHTSAAEVLALEPDGVFLSNGPGDPAAVTDAIETVRALLGRGHAVIAVEHHLDFIAAAEYLIDQGYTRPGRLAIEGGSNGGLLVGAVLVQRPEVRVVVHHDRHAVALAQVGQAELPLPLGEHDRRERRR
mgnify:CR=1 FL=1